MAGKAAIPYITGMSLLVPIGILVFLLLISMALAVVISVMNPPPKDGLGAGYGASGVWLAGDADW